MVEPYIEDTFSTPLGKLYNADCFDILKDMPDKSIDLIITDPPYNISRQRKFTMKGKTPINLDFGEWDKWETQEEYLDWCKLWLAECHRVLKDTGNILVWHDKVMPIGYIMSKVGYKFKNLFSWNKTNPIPSFMKINFLSGFELATWCIKKDLQVKATFNFKMQKEMRNYIEHPITCGNERTAHPTQKPVKIIKHLIEILSNPNDLVLDIFAGSSTTAVACEELNRQWICVEKEKDYYEISKKRLLNADTMLIY